MGKTFMSNRVLSHRSPSRHLSTPETRLTTGAGVMSTGSFLAYHATEYVLPPPMTSRPFSDYDREELVLSVKRQVERLLSLQRPNWDSYGARPIASGAVERAAGLVIQLIEHEMPAPRLYPLSDGGVRLEWVDGDAEVYIDVSAVDEPTAYYTDERTGDEWEGSVSDAPDALLDLVARFP